jgi:hypothetical protein
MYIHNTGAAIIGGIQSRIMPRIFAMDSFEDGLIPRFLLLPIDEKPVRFSKMHITESDRTYWKTLLERCYQIETTQDMCGVLRPRAIILSREAVDEYADFFNEYHELSIYLSESERVFIPKLVTYCVKFCGVLHVLNSITRGTEIGLQIELATIRGAIKLTRFFGYELSNTLKLYDKETPKMNEYLRKTIETLFELKDEVSNGKLSLSRIIELLDTKIPEQLRITPEKVSKILNGLGLITEKSTGNLSVLVWEPEKMNAIFSTQAVTTVTSVTDYQPHGQSSGVAEWN